MAIMNIVDKIYGDKRLVWREDDKESQHKARNEFKERISKGWLAFRVDPKNPGQGTMLKEFDKKTNKIVLTPPPAKG